MDIELFDKRLLTSIGQKILSKSQTLAVAESVTAGLLQFAFSSIEKAQHFFHGGTTAYNIAQKFKHLNVEPIHALSCNCVSQRIAAEMARNVARNFNSDWGIGITGYATPVEESGNEVFAYYAISFQGEIKGANKLISGNEMPPAPQIHYVTEVLRHLEILLA